LQPVPVVKDEILLEIRAELWRSKKTNK